MEAHSIPVDGCILWTGTLLHTGYGYARSGKRSVRAHRLAWEIERGAIPDGLWVLHTCDNRRCINPAHLFLGDVQDNTDDMCNKGRNAKGFRLPHTKLGPLEVLDIRARLDDGYTVAEVARLFKVHRITITQVRERRSFKYL